METDVKRDGNSDAEGGSDIPSDFFDDFNKADFIEGLSVIDSWDDVGNAKNPNSRTRINAEAVDSVKDLRELIRDGKQDRREKNERDNRNRRTHEHFKRSKSKDLDNFIKPGSRRDPDKTNEAIKKDKDMKVKEYLAKSLESSDDIRPPGTELDDFFDEAKAAKEQVTREVKLEPLPPGYRSRSPRERQRRESPRRQPQRRMRESPIRRRESPTRRRESPTRRRESPVRWRESPRHSPRRYSPIRSPGRGRRHFSPPRRFGPVRRSPRRHRRSRSPVRRSPEHRSSYKNRQQSPDNKDPFLYPTSTSRHFEASSSQSYPPAPSWDANPSPIEYPVATPGYSYPSMVAPQPGPAYSGGYGAPYDYTTQPGILGAYVPPSYSAMAPVPAPQPVPAPAPVPAPVLAAPLMVPAPQMTSTSLTIPQTQQQNESATKTPYDALAQLVADGRISKEDYLKLTPNKGSLGTTPMDLKEKVDLLGRCHNAVTKLSLLHLPNKLVMHHNMVGPEPKVLTQKFCSPLKRQPPVEFHFTRTTGASAAQQNKQLIDSIISTIGLDKVLSKPKKNPNGKDIAVQTTKPFCDVCEIRDATKRVSVGTSTDPEYFSKSVHTQVVDHDLVNSKAVFTPSGGVSDSAPISIAHMTPAQLVSQLAARAKTLKQPEPEANPQFSRRNPTNYDYDRGGNQYNNYGNYDYQRY